MKLSRNLSEEQQRHVRENMTEEELVIFDILTRPAPELTPEERAEVKKIARELLNRLKQLLVLNWRQKSAARSQLKLAIEDISGHRATACLHARSLSAEMLGAVRTYVRELSRTKYGCLCSSGLNMR